MSTSLEIQFTGDAEAVDTAKFDTAEEARRDAEWAAAAPAPAADDNVVVSTGVAAPSASTPGTAQPPAPTGRPIQTAPAHFSGLPQFEGIDVAASVIKIVGSVTVDTHDEIVVSVDDRLRVVGEFRVTKVAHEVNPKDGSVRRVQYVALVVDSQLELVPWDPSNPMDDGISRARGQRP